MGSAEQERRDAVMRMLAGVPRARWTRIWGARTALSASGWRVTTRRMTPGPKSVLGLQGCRRARLASNHAGNAAKNFEEETERLVLEITQRLQDNPWAQVGAVAIAWEMEKLAVTPPPSRERSSVSRSQLVIKPNAVHKIDAAYARGRSETITPVGGMAPKEGLFSIGSFTPSQYTATLPEDGAEAAADLPMAPTSVGKRRELVKERA